MGSERNAEYPADMRTKMGPGENVGLAGSDEPAVLAFVGGSKKTRIRRSLSIQLGPELPSGSPRQAAFGFLCDIAVPQGRSDARLYAGSRRQLLDGRRYHRAVDRRRPRQHGFLGQQQFR